MFFVQACLQLPVGFDGSEQYFWICNGSCAAFYFDDFISDFTEQRAYAIWNGIAFLAAQISFVIRPNPFTRTAENIISCHWNIFCFDLSSRARRGDNAPPFLKPVEQLFGNLTLAQTATKTKKKHFFKLLNKKPYMTPNTIVQPMKIRIRFSSSSNAKFRSWEYRVLPDTSLRRDKSRCDGGLEMNRLQSKVTGRGLLGMFCHRVSLSAFAQK